MIRVKPTIVLSAIALLFTSRAYADYPKTFDAAAHLADQIVGTRAGREYTNKFADATDQAVAQAMRACVTGRKTETRYRVIFIVSSDGHIVRTFHTPGHPVGDCMARNLHMPKTVPKPPRDGWPVDWVIVHAP
jgi:hypothetical protein